MHRRSSYSFGAARAAVLVIVLCGLAAVRAACPSHDQIMHTNPFTGESRIVFTAAAPLASVAVTWRVNGAPRGSGQMTPSEGNRRWEQRGIRLNEGDTIQYAYAVKSTAGESCPTPTITVAKGQIPTVAFAATDDGTEPRIATVAPVMHGAATAIDRGGMAMPLRSGFASPAAPAQPLDLKPNANADASVPLRAEPMRPVRSPLSPAAAAPSETPTSTQTHVRTTVAAAPAAAAGAAPIRVVAPFTNVVIGA